MRVWVQVSAGRGPAECALSVANVVSCLLKEAQSQHLKAEVLEATPGPFPDTLDSVLLAVEGKTVHAFLSTWVGTVQWIARSPFRPEYKRKNWFVGVESFEIPATPVWSERELKFETMRASGPGGQNLNKTESAVRVTHLPSGIAVTAREERSQLANRKLALARLAQELDGIGKRKERSARRERWSQHNALERGNPIRVYEGERFVRK